MTPRNLTKGFYEVNGKREGVQLGYEGQGIRIPEDTEIEQLAYAALGNA